MLSSKNNRVYSKIYTKNKCVCLNNVENENEAKIKNRSQRHEINICLGRDMDTNIVNI